jgi:hypothetical protein
LSLLQTTKSLWVSLYCLCVLCCHPYALYPPLGSLWFLYDVTASICGRELPWMVSELLTKTQRNTDNLIAVRIASNSAILKHLWENLSKSPPKDTVENKGLSQESGNSSPVSDENQPAPHRTEGHRSQQSTVHREDREQHREHRGRSTQDTEARQTDTSQSTATTEIQHREHRAV